MREAGLDEAWCQTFITADNALAERLATDSRVAFLSFIGSARVGWHLHSRLAPGTRCALEHGGAAPVIVDRSANLDAVIEPIVKGGYYHAGQVCVSTQRIFVHQDILGEFVERLTARVARFRVGDPLMRETEVGPLIDPRETSRVASWIEEATSAGRACRRRPILGDDADARRPDGAAGRCQGVAAGDLGPVTCVYGFHQLDRAIDIANSLPFAFQASIFSTDIGPALRAAERLDASCVLINDHTAFRTDWMPFAGRRQSGYGVGGIPASMADMSQEKMVVLRHEM